MQTAQQELKAIDTHYDGHLFRSRLEARWAVFFKTLDVHYEYEPEGYELESLCYLPDFLIPEWQCFFEIKPRSFRPAQEPEVIIKALELQQRSGKRAMIIVGDPWPQEYVILAYDLSTDGETFACCFSVSHGRLGLIGKNFNLEFQTRLDSKQELLRAFRAAREIRFEGNR